VHPVSRQGFNDPSVLTATEMLGGKVQASRARATAYRTARLSQYNPFVDKQIGITYRCSIIWQEGSVVSMRHSTVRNPPLGPVFRGVLLLALGLSPLTAQGPTRARALGVAPGVFTPGPLNAITDVAGVRVGHATLLEGDSVRTGITAVLPHGGNPYLERVPAAVVVGNAFGKLVGATQVAELGELETPILLTCTLCVWRVADALVQWMLDRPGMDRVRSINPVVGETNDGRLNAIRSRPVTTEAVRAALESANGGPVAEGSVGAGTGTTAFGWKAGIGTSSRQLPSRLGGWTVGVLVQSNFGGVLQVLGAPVGRELGRYAFRGATDSAGDGSIMIVVATDAPLSARNLERLARRGLMGLARTSSSGSNGSGDYALAFSTAESVGRRPLGNGERARTVADLANDGMSGLFQAVIEATEEAIYNSLFTATTVESRFGRAEAIPLDRVREILAKYGGR
jgi:D-aminopeptidase